MKEYKCKYCKKSLKSSKSVGAHSKWCKSNPNRDIPFKNVTSEMRKEINSKINSDPNKIEKSIKTFKENYIQGTSKGRASTKEKEMIRRAKISSSMKKNPNAGGLRKGSGIGKKCWYESPIAGKVYLDSSYELKYAEWLDKNNINWERCTESFEYEYENKKKKYYPDFYLIDQNLYIEIKGYQTKKDEAKWSYFPEKLMVLFKKDLEKLGETSQ